MEREEEVFVDAEEEVTPRRSGRKRRSTAGSALPASSKKSRAATTKTMPTERSPKKAADGRPKQPPDASDDPDGYWKRMGSMLNGLESRMKREMELVREQLGRSIVDLGSRVEQTEKRLDNLADEVGLIVDKKLASGGGGPLSMLTPGSDDPGLKEGTSYAAALAKASVSPRTLLAAAGKKKEDDYWECRKALRLRPIKEGPENREVLTFLKEHMKLSDEFLSCLGPIQVRRIPFGPGAKIRHEAIVTFQSVDTRDAVRGAARNLAGLSSDYGVRLEIPNRLKSAMKSLQSISYDLKQKYPGSRRNVLFDDESQDLVLDFCLREGEQWRRLTSKQAKDRKKKTSASATPGAGQSRFNLADDELDGLLDAGVTTADGATE